MDENPICGEQMHIFFCLFQEVERALEEKEIEFYEENQCNRTVQIKNQFKSSKRSV